MKDVRETPGRVVPRRFPLALVGRSGKPQPALGKSQSGRLELARWLTDPKNPLTARVMVNRIWQYHFGKGIVQTPNDFGRMGAAPTSASTTGAWRGRRGLSAMPCVAWGTPGPAPRGRSIGCAWGSG